LVVGFTQESRHKPWQALDQAPRGTCWQFRFQLGHPTGQGNQPRLGLHASQFTNLEFEKFGSWETHDRNAIQRPPLRCSGRADPLDVPWRCADFNEITHFDRARSKMNDAGTA